MHHTPFPIGPLRRVYAAATIAGAAAELASDESALGSDLAQRLTVGRTRHGDADRARRTVAREADHPDVVAEVLAAELGADTGPPGDLEDLLLKLGVAEPD